MKTAFGLNGKWYACNAYTYGEMLRDFRNSPHWEAGNSFDDYLRIEGFSPVPDSDDLYFDTAWSIDELTAWEIQRDA